MTSECILEMARGEAAITGLIGEGQDLRMYPNRAPDGETHPYVTFRRLITTPSNRFDGVSQYDNAAYDFFFHGNDRHELELLSSAFRSAFEGLKGSFGGIDVDHVEFVNQEDSFSDGIDFYEITQEYNIKHRR